MIVSKTGSERVLLSTSLFDMMTYTDDHQAKSHIRRCFVHKNRVQTHASQFTNAAGLPVSIVQQPVFDDVYTVLTNAMHKIQDLERDKAALETQCEAYRMTINTLKKNGVID